MTISYRVGPDLIECWEDDEDNARSEAWGDVETACVECDHQSGGDGCNLCGAPLCYQCYECSAGFCDSCLADPDFGKLMTELTGGTL